MVWSDQIAVTWHSKMKHLVSRSENMTEGKQCVTCSSLLAPGFKTPVPKVIPQVFARIAEACCKGAGSALLKWRLPISKFRSHLPSPFYKTWKSKWLYARGEQSEQAASAIPQNGSHQAQRAKVKL